MNNHKITEENEMIKFETINGTLCRMVEPTPLQLDSELPCVVRLIQNDSRMGMFNRDTKPSRLSDFYLAARIVSNNIVVDEFMESDYHRFEIIGYPVEEGSKEWALYQMMQGKMVCHETSPRDWYRMYNDHAIQNRTVGYMDRVSAWLESTVQSGWQIYKEHEPKPLLADAKVGDLCKTDLDEWIQIDDAYPESPSPILYHYDRPFKGNIIHTEPLAPEGTAEWALQMWKLGNDIRNETGVVLMADYESEEIRVKHLVDVFPSGWQLYKEPKPKPTKEPEIVAHKQHANCLVCGKEIGGLLDGHATVSIKRYSISSLYESTYSHYCGKCFLELGFDATERELRNRQQPIANPEPAKEQFEVGDWLEFIDVGGRKSQGKYLSNTDGNAIIILDTTCNMRVVVHTTKIIRKLSPSEVVVPITISGTVRTAYNEDGTIDDEQFQLLPNGSWDGTEMFISFDALDSHTRKLVESLLKAQEEEK